MIQQTLKLRHSIVAEFKNSSQREMIQQVLPFALIHGEVVIEKPQDLFIPPDALEIMLESFSGPLDLLLYLIRKQKFDILELPILPISKQYMKYIALMDEMNLELAAEYLVMAAALAEIKSRLLLPKQNMNESEYDPRAELIRRLQAYEVIKDAAEKIEKLPRIERDVYVAEAKLAENFKYQIPLVDVNMDELVFALSGVLKRNQALAHHHIEREVLSTRERMSAILQQLTKHQNQHDKRGSNFIEFSQFFQVNEGKQGVVVTFIAILELIKESLVHCIQSENYGRLQISLC